MCVCVYSVTMCVCVCVCVYSVTMCVCLCVCICVTMCCLLLLFKGLYITVILNTSVKFVSCQNNIQSSMAGLCTAVLCCHSHLAGVLVSGWPLLGSLPCGVFVWVCVCLCVCVGGGGGCHLYLLD